MPQTIDLRVPKHDLRKVKTGTLVITSKGFKFKLVKRTKDGKESWKDLTSGIIWYDKEDSNYTYEEAITKFGESLPTKEDFETAETHGFREILPNMDYWYWSASLYSYDRNSSWIFNGISGAAYLMKCSALAADGISIYTLVATLPVNSL